MFSLHFLIIVNLVFRLFGPITIEISNGAKCQWLPQASASLLAMSWPVCTSSKKLIRALNDTAGSRTAYRKLISELLNLEEALSGVSKVQVDPTQAAQKMALEKAAG